jgi:hypothetical protein
MNLEQQLLQKMRPHDRQWCRRRKGKKKRLSQERQQGASASRIQTTCSACREVGLECADRLEGCKSGETSFTFEPFKLLKELRDAGGDGDRNDAWEHGLDEYNCAPKIFSSRFISAANSCASAAILAL